MKFSELKTVPSINALIGDKVKVADILGKSIVVTGYNVTKSKRNDGRCLKMQFYYADDQAKTFHIIFTGSKTLINQIQKADQQLKNNGQDFLIETIIRSNTGYYTFT